MSFQRGFIQNLSIGLLGATLGSVVSIYILSLHDPVAFFNGACISQYPLTSRLLDCDKYDDLNKKLSILEEKFQGATDSYLAQKKATRISVWVRDLTTLQWAAVKENEAYIPASLLKVPLMVAYFKIAEIEPTILDTKLPYTRSPLLNSSSQDFVPQQPLIEGKQYSVKELIEQMVTHSDNDAAATLLAHIDPHIFEETLVDLGIKIPESAENLDFVTVKTYGSIFRQLYNASYLTREYSEQALSILSKTSFKGIAASLPQGTTVAHKFGEREVTDQAGNSQTRLLHDCGIVYKDTDAYLICIMTEGKNFADLLQIIQDLSLIAYNEL